MNFDFSKPFPADNIDWRVQQDGVYNNKPWCRVLAYVDARAIQNRLDSIVGIENWKDEYIHKDDGVMCGISIKIGDEWVTKWNGSPETKIESFKGGISKAFVRCASNWGIGRYLYSLKSNYGIINENGVNYQKAHGNTPAYKWNPPELPTWALPEIKPNEKTKGDIKHAEKLLTDSTLKSFGVVMNELNCEFSWTDEERDKLRIICDEKKLGFKEVAK
ncbi:MAG: recombinase [archaeon]|nr:recombinase [archaeon]